MHEKAARQTSNTAFWHLLCLLSSHQILSVPLIIASNMADADCRAAMRLRAEQRRHPAGNAAHTKEGKGDEEQNLSCVAEILINPNGLRIVFGCRMNDVLIP